MLAKKAEAEGRIAELRKEIGDATGGVDIGANAGTTAFKKHLYVTLGLPVCKRTKGNREAADDESMILLSEHCATNRPALVPLFKSVQEYRKWGKLVSTYIDGYMKHINSATGRIHPDLLSLGTETGRYASRNPNCQNMLRPGNDPMGVRDFFTAPEGKTLLSLDFSQVELRVGAFYCRDEKMLEVYRTGGDIHAATTAVLYGITPEQAADKHAPHFKERRTIAKNTNFGIFFGLFPNGLKANLKFKAGLDTPLEECERIIANIKTGYPGLTRWQEKTKKQATVCGYTETWHGRRRYLPGIRSDDWGKRAFAERVSLNHPIQGTAAEILKLAMGRILTGLPERLWLSPLLQVHDELLFEIPADRAAEAVAFIKDCMEAQPFPECDVPIVAEATIGQRYGQMEEC
jgi:DNA polymerase-1